MQALRNFCKDPGPPLFFPRTLRKAHGLEESAKLRCKNACFGGVVASKEIGIRGVNKHDGPEDFIGKNQRHRHDGTHTKLRSHGIARGVEAIGEKGFFPEDGLIRDRALVSAQTCPPELGRHPTIRFYSDELVRWQELPDIRAANLEVTAGLMTEEFQNLRGRSRLSGGSGELKKQILKRVVLSTTWVRMQNLFGPDGQTSPCEKRKYASKLLINQTLFAISI